MRTEKREFKKVEYKEVYIANDGTVFQNVEECRKYEQTAKCAIRSDIINLESEEAYEVLNRFFIGIFGWSLETLLKRAMLKEGAKG